MLGVVALFITLFAPFAALGAFVYADRHKPKRKRPRR